MTLIEEVEVKLERSDLLNRVPVERRKLPKRAPGMHLSGILRYTLSSYRMPGWQKYLIDLDEDEGLLPLLWALGIAWEEFCVSLYPSTMWQPGEVSVEDPTTTNRQVWMNCDGLYALPGGGLALDEFKYTSCKRKPADQFLRDWLKMQQGLGYCAGYGAEYVRWHVLWNYQPYKPQYIRYLVQFTLQEIEASKRMIFNNRAAAERAGYGEKAA